MGYAKCRGCGKGWLTLHRLDCPVRDTYRYVLARHCGAHDLWPADRNARTAPHGDKAGL